MEDRTKRKFKAAGKIGFGLARMISGGITAMGRGIIGEYLNDHGMRNQAFIIGKASAEAGQKMLDEGMKEWEEE